MKKLFFLLFLCQFAFSQSLTISKTQDIAVDETNIAIEPFSLNGYDPTQIFKVSLSLSGTPGVTFDVNNTLGLTRDSGYSSWTTITSVNFTGLSTDIENALNSLRFNSTATVGAQIILNIVITKQISNTFYNPVNGHIYKFISGNISFLDARNAALADTYEGEPGYLVTITSADEQSFISNKTNASNIWTGLSDQNTEGDWIWLDGPEAGTVIRLGNGTKQNDDDQNVAGQYNNWCGGEPNDYSTGEDYVVTNWSNGSCWNDYGPPFTTSITDIGGYLIEFGTWSSPASSTFSFTTNQQITLTQVKVDPIIDINDITKNYGDPDFNLTATSSSTGAFTFTVSDTSIATVSGTTVEIVSAGTTIIEVNQATDSKYNAATTTITLTINKISPTIVFNDITKNFGDPDFALIASSTSSGTITYSIADLSVANISSDSVSIVGGGTTVVTLNQAESENYTAGSASMTLTINTINGLIQFDDLTKTYGDPNFNFSATSSGTGAMTFTISDTSIATMVGSSTQITGAGNTIVTVNQAADSNYNAATATMTLTVNKANPQIIFEDVIKNINELQFTLTATSNSSGTFSYVISDTSLANVAGSDVTMLNLGETVVTVNQAVEQNFNAGIASMTLQIVANPVIQFNGITKTYGDPNFDITASSTSPAPFIFSIQDTSIASLISSATIRIENAGSTTVFVKQKAMGFYNALTSSMTLTVQKASPTILLDDIVKTYGDDAFQLQPSSSSSGDFSFSIENSTVASVNVDRVTILGAGTTPIKVFQTGDRNYKAGETRSLLTVIKASPNIIFEDIVKELGDPTFEINYQTNSRGAVRFSIYNENIGSLTEASLLPLKLGETLITLNQSETNNYTSGVATASFIVIEKIDSDLDGITDSYDLDDDNDGILDRDESVIDLDGDGLLNSVDLDSDGDGCFDVVEAGFSDDDFDGIVGTSPVVVDSQGLVQQVDAYSTPLDQNQNALFDFLEFDQLIDLEIYKLPEKIEFNLNDNILLTFGTNEINALHYQWQKSTNNGISYENLDNNNFTLTINSQYTDDQTLYRVIVDQENFACAAPYISNSTKLIYKDLFIPTGISPDGDGINDYWQIIGIENYPNNSVSIFNRTGVKIFSATNYKNDWNGYYNGKPIPDGIYFYELNLGANNTKKGFIYVKSN